MTIRLRTGALIPWLALSLPPALTLGEAQAQERADADVVVVVDTSLSMTEPNMDPQRASLLVTKLFSDIVPGELATIRLLDVDDDRALIPSRSTGEPTPCKENPAATCYRVEQEIPWDEEAYEKQLGAIKRPLRGDPGYKRSLDTHLEQRSGNSMFWLAFLAAQGIFDENRGAAAGRPQTLIWLSDGRPEADPEFLRSILAGMQAQRVAVEALVFGGGDTAPAQQLGLPVERVSTPRDVMRAFAGAFRRIVQAPFEIDKEVAVDPTFEIKPTIEEAWVVVYGDASLSSVELEGPEGTVAADYAADRHEPAGAYRVAYLEHPADGRWRVRAEGGGPRAALAVVQRSALMPVLLEPEDAIAGAEVPVVVGIRAGARGELVADAELLRGAGVTLEVAGRTVALEDGGGRGDTARDDGLYSALHRFTEAGDVPVRIRLRTAIVDRSVDEVIRVAGLFKYRGGAIELNLGDLGVGGAACKPLRYKAEHKGAIPFALEEMRSLAGGHELSLRAAGETLRSGREPLRLEAGAAKQICLETSARAYSSRAEGEHWLTLSVAGSTQADQQIRIHLRWEVQGLTWWQRWKWVVLGVLGVLLALFVIGGFVYPQRLPRGLALAFGPEWDDVEEQTPQPVRQWRGIGIGFYRHARAFLHGDYRISGRGQGALAGLHAEKGGCRVRPQGALSLFRQNLDGDWDPLDAEGRRARSGDVYRVGEAGPFFRVAIRS